MLAAASAVPAIRVVPLGPAVVVVPVKTLALAAFVGPLATRAMTVTEFRELRRFSRSIVTTARHNAEAR